jgi:hypothetical protein
MHDKNNFHHLVSVEYIYIFLLIPFQIKFYFFFCFKKFNLQIIYLDKFYLLINILFLIHLYQFFHLLMVDDLQSKKEFKVIKIIKMYIYFFFYFILLLLCLLIKIYILINIKETFFFIF